MGMGKKRKTCNTEGLMSTLTIILPKNLKIYIHLLPKDSQRLIQNVSVQIKGKEKDIFTSSMKLTINTEPPSAIHATRTMRKRSVSTMTQLKSIVTQLLNLQD